MTTARRVLIGLGVLCALTGVATVPAASHPAAPKAKKQAPAPPPGPRCGNGIVEPGEACDDGNTVDGDACPANCRVASCWAIPGRFAVSVSLDRAPDPAVRNLVVFLDYPEGAVALPGYAAAPGVAERVTKVAPDFISAPYDLDYGLRETIVAMRPVPAGELFRVTFYRCSDTPPPAAKDFSCRVMQATAPDGKSLAPAALTCSVKTL